MVEKVLPIISYDDSVKDRMLNALGFSQNKKSELVGNDGKVATSQDFDTIKHNEFAGVLSGSKIPIKKKESELVKYFFTKED